MTRLPLIGLTALLLGFISALPAAAEIVHQEIAYTYDEVEYIGHAYWDDTTDAQRPGVYVMHEWWGLNDFAKSRAEQLAAMGFVAFACDMYGGGKTTTEFEQASAWSAEIYENLPRGRAIALAGLDQLTALPVCDPERLAAIGFCFGGTGVLQMAYAGADLDAVVSFHGNPIPPGEGEAANITGRILVCHGAADPYVEPATIKAFSDALNAGGVDWEFMAYGGTVHSFTNPAAGDDPTVGAAYNERSATRAWNLMTLFFMDVFK